MKRLRWFAAGMYIAAVLSCLLHFVIIPVIRQGLIAAKEGLVKQQLHSIGLALERRQLANDDGLYPLNVQTVITEGYLSEFPANVYTGRPMRPIRPGERPFDGEFTYTPLYEEGQIRSYELTGYGSLFSTAKSRIPGAEHVVITLGSGMYIRYASQ